MSNVVKVSDVEALLDILDSNEYVVVDYSAESWCAPCKALAPHFDAASEMVPVPFVKVDIDTAPDIAEGAGIKSVPTVILYENGKKARELKGRSTLTLIKELTND